MKRYIAAAIAAACLSVPMMGFAAASTEPDATIELKGGTVGVGVGVSWGHGTLHYHGRSIPVSVNGLSVAAIGVGSISVAGDVYNLKRLSDFEGNYASASAGAALAGGGAVAAMENDKGVVIHMRSTTQGVELKLSVDGVAVKLQQ